MRRCKTTFGDAKLIRGRIQWRGEAPPATGISPETVQQVRQRVTDILDALLVILVRQARKRFPKKLALDRRADRDLIEELPNYINHKAFAEFNEIYYTLQQADGHVSVGHHNMALVHYVNALELVLAAQCFYEMNPEGAFGGGE